MTSPTIAGYISRYFYRTLRKPADAEAIGPLGRGVCVLCLEPSGTNDLVLLDAYEVPNDVREVAKHLLSQTHLESVDGTVYVRYARFSNRDECRAAISTLRSELRRVRDHKA